MTALDDSYTNPSSLSCTFEGTAEPTIAWYSGDTIISSETTDDPYTEDAGTWENNTVTSVLSIDDTLTTGETAITCKVTFDGDADVTDPLQTVTTVIKRGRTTF